MRTHLAHTRLQVQIELLQEHDEVHAPRRFGNDMGGGQAGGDDDEEGESPGQSQLDPDPELEPGRDHDHSVFLVRYPYQQVWASVLP